MSAAEEIGKLEAAVAQLQIAMKAVAAAADQQGTLLVQQGKRLDALEKVSTPPPAPPPPSPPPPAPPPAPEPPSPPPAPTRTDAQIRAVITEEMAKATTFVLPATAMTAWINHFKQSQFAAMDDAAFRDAVKGQVLIDRQKYSWPVKAGSSTTQFVVVSGQSVPK